jgi:phosphonate transport system ATP-binding protein
MIPNQGLATPGLLVTQNLERRFGESIAVSGVSFEVPRGQMVAIIGRSGAGKSTLLNLTNRLLDPTSGSIFYEGLDIARLKGDALLAWRRNCAMIFQRFNLVHRIDVLTNVLTGRLNYPPRWPKLFGHFSEEDRDRAIDALYTLGMDDQALKRADQLSGGQQQRVAIARALVQEPKIILADEPVASLDPINSKSVMDALRAINQERGITVLCNLHSVPLAKEYCDRIIGLNAGKVVFDGVSSELGEQELVEVYGSLAALGDAV